VKQFLGEIDQNHPYSPLLKDGVRLYEHAHAGETVEIAFRKRPSTNLKLPELLPEIDFGSLQQRNLHSIACL
jgi:tRNA pseudouridine55 synthase